MIYTIDFYCFYYYYHCIIYIIPLFFISHYKYIGISLIISQLNYQIINYNLNLKLYKNVCVFYK